MFTALRFLISNVVRPFHQYLDGSAGGLASSPAVSSALAASPAPILPPAPNYVTTDISEILDTLQPMGGVPGGWTSTSAQALITVNFKRKTLWQSGTDGPEKETHVALVDFILEPAFLFAFTRFSLVKYDSFDIQLIPQAKTVSFYFRLVQHSFFADRSLSDVAKISFSDALRAPDGVLLSWMSNMTVPQVVNPTLPIPPDLLSSSPHSGFASSSRAALMIASNTPSSPTSLQFVLNIKFKGKGLGHMSYHGMTQAML